MDQFIGVNTDGRHAHTGAHDRDSLAVIGACIAVHIADRVELDRILQIGLGKRPGAERVSGKKDGFGNFSGFRGIMRCWHFYLLF